MTEKDEKITLPTGKTISARDDDLSDFGLPVRWGSVGARRYRNPRPPSGGAVST